MLFYIFCWCNINAPNSVLNEALRLWYPCSYVLNLHLVNDMWYKLYFTGTLRITS